eukprot:2419441-Pleurochrysis_carterae.AAC.2
MLVAVSIQPCLLLFHSQLVPSPAAASSAPLSLIPFPRSARLYWPPRFVSFESRKSTPSCDTAEHAHARDLATSRHARTHTHTHMATRADKRTDCTSSARIKIRALGGRGHAESGVCLGQPASFCIPVSAVFEVRQQP